MFEERYQERLNVLAYNLDTKPKKQKLRIVEDLEVTWKEQVGKRVGLRIESRIGKRGKNKVIVLEESEQEFEENDEDLDLNPTSVAKTMKYRVVSFVKGRVVGHHKER